MCNKDNCGCKSNEQKCNCGSGGGCCHSVEPLITEDNKTNKIVNITNPIPKKLKKII